MHGPDPSWCARLHAPGSAPHFRHATGEHVGRGERTRHDGRDAAPGDVSETASIAPPSENASPDLPAPTPFVYREIPSVHECEICGRVMYDHNCKIVCPNCGYKRDCSDP
ncbi:MAG: hypothetical protein JWM27_2595 [Gemmatimonadetes bacterium]|nr:hypothetical protein [Gemmatimonadota bacterium]